MRDFLNILQETHYYMDSYWNRTDCIYTFPGTNSIIEFFSADQPGKVRGPRRDVLFVNEGNNITYEIYTQLEIRTRDIIWIDSNPTNEYWVYTEVIPNNDIDFITLTYKDNEALEQSVIDSIESHRNNSNWYKVYALGQLGEIESRIYTNWNTDVDEIPARARLVSRGLDFGYSNDPAAIVDIYKYDQGFLLDEVLYRKGVGNRELANILLSLYDPELPVYADSAEPKSIDEIGLYGVNIVPAQKGSGSINQGIQYVQSQYISVTKRSINLIKEYRNYLWQTDKDGRIINKAEDMNNHLMDALRYGLETYIYSQAPSRYATMGSVERPKDMAYGTSDGRIVAPGLDIGKLLQNKNERDWRSM